MRISDWSSDVCSSDPPSAATWIALHADLHMRQTGLKREQLAMIAINQRKNAALNPNAVYREPITLDEYFDARMITTPFCIYDCDVPIDGAAAVVISRADAIPASSRPTVRRSEEHTSELQSLMRISYAVFCLKKKKT